MKKSLLILFSFCFVICKGQYTFNNANNGRRVVLVQTVLTGVPQKITLQLLDAAQNPGEGITIYRRPLMSSGTSWVLKATLAGGTTQWTDNETQDGDVWEYQVRRNTGNGDAIGYTCGAIRYDQTGYKGRLILLVDSSLLVPLEQEISVLKKDMAGDGWLPVQVNTSRANGWYSGAAVQMVKNKITAAYNQAPPDDKPKLLFILGHVPIPRSGRDAVAPDEHDENKGARGADTYYADIDGVYNDTGTYNPGTLATPLAINLPGDFKWDEDFLPSPLEMGFGRVDFADLSQSYPGTTETALLRRYLNRLHAYKQVAPGWYMGNRCAFNFGYDNSNDGSYRSLVPIASSDSVKQREGSNPHPQWVKQNGPFMQYMQNVTVPDLQEWNTFGMDATVFSSDQSYYGFGDVEESGPYSKIRALLAADTKCLVTIWTTMGINIFHQPGTGVPFGVACKQIMNHNETNNILEKPSQEYDTPDWWNRTHFQLHGDPSLRFFQVHPPGDLSASFSDSGALCLKWKPSLQSNMLGYHVYRSDSEFGNYVKATVQPVTDTFFVWPTTDFGGWFMVRSITEQVTGSGSFINASQGAFTTVYHFNGSGNWSNSSNWQQATPPPAVLSKGQTVIINPQPGGECILDINQQALPESSITVKQGKKIIITGNLEVR